VWASSARPLIKRRLGKAQKEFLPQILDAKIEFAVGYSEPNAGSDAAAMRLKAERQDDGWLLNGQKVFTPRRTSPTGTGSARAPIRR